MASSIVKNVTNADPDDPRWTNNTKWKPYSRNLYALKGVRPENVPWRRTVKKLGEGSFGRVNLEQIRTPFHTNGFIATKYFDERTFTKDSIQEIATLKYLKGFPNVAQYVGLAYKPALTVVYPTPSQQNLNFPGLIMGAAKTSLTDKTVFSSWDTIFSTIVGVLHGVHVMHSLRIVHRDIKPANILMTQSGEPWITDFGSSKYISESNEMPGDNWTGTYLYASPETLLKVMPHSREYYLKEWHHSLKSAQKWKEEYSTTFEDLQAADAWSVGMSLIDILTTADTLPYIWPLKEETDIEKKASDDLLVEDPVAYDLLADDEKLRVKGMIIRQIFRRMGLPTDGITQALYESYARSNKPSFVPFKSPSPKEYILLHLAQPIDTTNPEFQKICDVIEGLLHTDPKQRLTIQDALGTLGVSHEKIRLPATVVPPLKASNITTQMIEDKVSWLYKKAVDPQTKPSLTTAYNRNCIFDRTCCYIYWYLSVNPELPKDDLLTVVVVSYLLASSLFQTNSIDFSDIIGDIGIWCLGSCPPLKMNKILQTFLKSDIPLLGRTILDDMCVKMPNKRDKLGFLNILCLMRNIYGRYPIDTVKDILTTHNDRFSGAIPSTYGYPAEFEKQFKQLLAEKNNNTSKRKAGLLNMVARHTGNNNSVLRGMMGGKTRKQKKRR